jgi:hypothetical protein
MSPGIPTPTDAPSNQGTHLEQHRLQSSMDTSNESEEPTLSAADLLCALEIVHYTRSRVGMDTLGTSPRNMSRLRRLVEASELAAHEPLLMGRTLRR